MARYEVTTETARSLVSRTTGASGTSEVRVRHHKRSGERSAAGALLVLTIHADGCWELRGESGPISSGLLPVN